MIKYVIHQIKKILKFLNLKSVKIKKNQEILDFIKQKLFIYYTGHDLIRLGNKGDGGYLCPNILNKIEHCLSLGVGNSSSFEDELLSRYNIKSYLVDGTVNYIGNHHFTKKNINAYNDENNITLEECFSEIFNKKDKTKDEKMGENKKNLILQMDIEGHEIEAILSISEDVLKRNKVLIIEFHHFNKLYDDTIFNLYNSLFTKILKNFTICHIHPNTHCGTTSFGKLEIPNTLEITFINNEEIITKRKIDYELPHYLDEKNIKNDPNLVLPKIFYY